MLTLFPDEQIVDQSVRNITLTTHRIWKDERDFGSSRHQSIMLEHITSCESQHRSKFWILLLGAIATAIMIGSLNDHTSEMKPVIPIPMIFCIILFFVTRHTVLVISSPSAKMVASMRGNKRDRILSFIDTIEQTKQKRISLLR